MRHPLDLTQRVRREEHRAALGATSLSSAWKLCCTSGSSPAIGSSRINSSGSCMKAWTSPSFCRLPVDSSCTGGRVGAEPLGQLRHAAVVDPPRSSAR